MEEKDRLTVRDELLAWAGDSGNARKTHRVLECDEIIELARGGLIEIGSHTVTHPQLSALNLDSQRYEILQSKRKLEEILDGPVIGFAYPHGRKCDYTDETVALVREAGFEYSCATSLGVIDQGADRFQLPRVQVQDMDGESFARLVSEWLHD